MIQVGLTCNEALSITRAGITALHHSDSSRPSRAYISLNNLYLLHADTMLSVATRIAVSVCLEHPPARRDSIGLRRSLAKALSSNSSTDSYLRGYGLV
jgi:hypothetical protein